MSIETPVIRCPRALQVLSTGLIQQAQAFVSDPCLPQPEGRAFCLRLIRALHEQGEALAKVSLAGTFFAANALASRSRLIPARSMPELFGACSSPLTPCTTCPACRRCRPASMRQLRPC